MNDIDVEKIETYADGILIVRIPRSLTASGKSEFIRSVQNMASLMNKPRPPVAAIPEGIEITSMSGEDLARIGLQRIPVEQAP